VDLVLLVWRQQLAAPSLQMDDSIYDFGASSLTVMVVQSRLNEWFQGTADVTELAEAQTPFEWARAYAALNVKNERLDEGLLRERVSGHVGQRSET
jgi:coronamic acid synthetase CmaA adenylation/thiolation didomain protein